MKSTFVILILLAMTGCFWRETPEERRARLGVPIIDEVKFDVGDKSIYAAQAVTLKRCCSLHGDDFAYMLIEWRKHSVDGVVDEYKRRADEHFYADLKPIAPNRIPIRSALRTSEEHYLSGSTRIPYEYCPTCERLMKEAEKNRPNQ